MTLNEAIHRMITCASLTGWCPRENECFLVANTLRDYQKACNFIFGSEPEPGIQMDLKENEADEEEDLIIEAYVPEVGFFLQQKPDFDFEHD